MVWLLLEAEADVHVWEDAGKTPLHYLALGQCVAPVRVLLEYRGN